MVLYMADIYDDLNKLINSTQNEHINQMDENQATIGSTYLIIL